MKWILLYIVSFSSFKQLDAQALIRPDTVLINSDTLQLKGLLWRPSIQGPLPAIIYCHGSYETTETKYDIIEQVSILGSLYAKNGYVFLGLFRRGNGLSKDQGVNIADLMAIALKEKGQEERNKIQIQQMQAGDFRDMIAGLKFLRQRKEVDTNRIVAAGHSFGGSLALLLTEHDRIIKSVVVFGAAGKSWNLSPQFRAKLIQAAKNISVPVFIGHAENDYSITPGQALDSVMKRFNKPHVLKIYPAIGSTTSEGHNFAFLSPTTWEADVIEFLRKNLMK